MLTKNQQAIVAAAAILLDDTFSEFTGTPEDLETAIVTELQAANAARNGVKAAPLKIVTDAFNFADAVAAEVGNQKVSTLITDLQNTESDAVGGKIVASIGDIIADYKAIKALA